MTLWCSKHQRLVNKHWRMKRNRILSCLFGNVFQGFNAMWLLLEDDRSMFYHGRLADDPDFLLRVTMLHTIFVDKFLSLKLFWDSNLFRLPPLGSNSKLRAEELATNTSSRVQNQAKDENKKEPPGSRLLGAQTRGASSVVGGHQTLLKGHAHQFFRLHHKALPTHGESLYLDCTEYIQSVLVVV